MFSSKKMRYILPVALVFFVIFISWLGNESIYKQPNVIIQIGNDSFSRENIAQEISVKPTDITKKHVTIFTQRHLLYLEAKRRGMHNSITFHKKMKLWLSNEMRQELYREFNKNHNPTKKQVHIFARKNLSHLFHPEMRQGKLMKMLENGHWKIWRTTRLLSKLQANQEIGVKISAVLFSLKEPTQSKNVRIGKDTIQVILENRIEELNPTTEKIQGYLRQKYIDYQVQQQFQEAIEHLAKINQLRIAPLFQ